MRRRKDSRLQYLRFVGGIWPRRKNTGWGSQALFSQLIGPCIVEEIGREFHAAFECLILLQIRSQSCAEIIKQLMLFVSLDPDFFVVWIFWSIFDEDNFRGTRIAAQVKCISFEDNPIHGLRSAILELPMGSREAMKSRNSRKDGVVTKVAAVYKAVGRFEMMCSA